MPWWSGPGHPATTRPETPGWRRSLAVRPTTPGGSGTGYSSTKKSTTDDDRYDGGEPGRHREPFDVCGKLPRGMTLLQASAGTGKTFTIAALTTRYVAEGLPIDRLLVITFTRMATGELRERVRERLVRAFDGLVASSTEEWLHADDEIVRHLAGGAERRGGEAASPVGQGHRGFRLGHDRDDPRVLPAGALRPRHGRRRRPGGDAGRGRERPLGRGGGRPLPAAVRQQAQRTTTSRGMRRWRSPRASSTNPTPTSCPICPTPRTCRPSVAASPRPCTQGDGPPEASSQDPHLRRRPDPSARHVGRPDQRGPAACARLRERYDVVLVDEFQDTDPVQWEIMHRAFGHAAADPRAHRGPQAGHLRLPRRRRPRVSRRPPGRCKRSGPST